MQQTTTHVHSIFALSDFIARFPDQGVKGKGHVE